MASFHFRLQPLIRLREAARDACREQLADALRVDDRLREQRTELEQSLRSARELQTVPAGRVDVDRLIEAQRFEAALTVELRHVDDQRRRVGEELERRRQALVEADREVKVLDKLKETRRAEHRRAAAAAEVARLDEAASRCRSEEADA